MLGFLHGKTELNLTAANVAGEWDNYINLVDIVQPNKTAAVPYLDGNGPIPDRYAKVTIFFSTTNEPWVQDIMVGPLPVSDKTSESPCRSHRPVASGMPSLARVDPRLLGRPSDTVHFRGVLLFSLGADGLGDDLGQLEDPVSRQRRLQCLCFPLPIF